MGWYAAAPQATYYESMPKVELHRHLEGSLRLSTLREIARQQQMSLPQDAGLAGLVQMQADEPLNFQNFLAKFQTLRLFYRTPEIIQRISREAVEDAARDQVRYMELRFTPVALSRQRGFALREVMAWVCTAVQQASRDFNLPVQLLVSVNRHEPVELAEEVIALAVEFRQYGVAGIDLAGNEAEFNADPFLSLFREARREGLALSVHAGEWGGAENVRQAIQDFEADRIGHGVRVLEDGAVVRMAAERGTAFEVCITSNVQTGIVPSLKHHPLPRMIEAGLNVTINSDDPGISNIRLSDEYRAACEELGLTRLQLQERVLAAAHAAILPAPEKGALARRLKIEMDILEEI
ncbi:MAG: adenosine deaminase [Chloroflexota bacterium]